MRPSDNHDHGRGFWRWGFNSVAWGLAGALVFSAFKLTVNNYVEHAVDKARADCLNIDPAKRTECAASIFNKLKVEKYDGHKLTHDSVHFMIGEKLVSLKVQKSLDCRPNSISAICDTNYKFEPM